MDETQYIQMVFGEWLPMVEIDISDEMKNEAVESIMEEHGTMLELEEFMEKYILIATDLQITEGFGHRCKFMFADISYMRIDARAEFSLYTMIEMNMGESNSILAKKCGRVSIDGGEYIEFDNNTTLRDLGLEKEGCEKLEFNCQFEDEY